MTNSKRSLMTSLLGRPMPEPIVPGQLWMFGTFGTFGTSDARRALVMTVGPYDGHSGTLCQCLWVSHGFERVDDHGVPGVISGWSLGDRGCMGYWSRVS